MRLAAKGVVWVCFALGAAGLLGMTGAATAAKHTARNTDAPAAAPSPPAEASPASPPAPVDQPITDRVLLVCDAAYLPARAVWRRTVEIGYDQKHVRTVAIDGLPVYAFSVRGTVIFTSLDNERIQINTATQTWTSDFRGLATSEGHCERGA
jgi:hypothetical protein